MLVTVWLWFYADTIDITQENWQKLIDMQHMLTGIDNIVLADRVCAVCLIIIIIIINVKINVVLSEDASRTRYTIKIKLKLKKWVLKKKSFWCIWCFLIGVIGTPLK